MRSLLSVSGAFAAAVLFAGSAFAQGDGEGQGRERNRQGPPPWAHAGGDHDGKPDRDGKPGRPRFQKPPLSEVDTDGDGKVSEAEREAFKEKMREKMMEKMRARVLEHFDENGDGVLSGKELNKVAIALMRKHHGQGRPRPGHDGDGKGKRPERRGPPQWSNAGGKHNGEGRQGPPPWAHAGGRGDGPVPFEE